MAILTHQNQSLIGGDSHDVHPIRAVHDIKVMGFSGDRMQPGNGTNFRNAIVCQWSAGESFPR
jgi:hypothetical protein